MAMQKRTITILSIIGALILLGGVAVAVGPYIYKNIVETGEPAAPKLEAPKVDATGEGGDLTGEWVVDSDGSYAGYRVKEVLRGVDVTVVGRTQKVTGTITVDDKTLKTAEVIVDVASIATGISQRDSYFRDSTMEVAKYPNATFKLTKPLVLPDDLFDGKKVTVNAVGDLTIHGTTRSETVRLDVVFDGEAIQVAGSIPVTFSTYNITAPDLGFVKVQKSGAIELLIALQ